MSALNYLFFIKAKATIRNIFSKWTSALLTLASLAFFGFLMFMMMSQKDLLSMMAPNNGIEGWLSLFSGYALFFLSIMVIQKRTAIVMKNDAHYIFAGPFSRHQTLGYLLFDTVKGIIMYALLAVAYLLLMMAGDIQITFGFVLALIVSSVAMFYFVFALITYFYFLEMIHPQARKLKIGLVIAIILYVGILVGINIMNHDMNIQLGLTSFISDPLFNYIPVFGWAKAGLMGFINQNWLICVLGLGGTLGISGILTWLIVNVKGDFYEQAINDAEWATNLREKAKQGSDAASVANKKIKEVKNAGFLKGAGAIYSKNLLLMKKTGTWLRKQEILLVAFYMLIAYFAKMGFVGYQYYVLIIIFISSTNSVVKAELKSHYIYLIPERPLKKLVYLILPPLLRILILVVISLLPCILVFQTSISDVLFGIVNLAGYVCVFMAGEICCMRIMKSRANMVVEQFLKMIIIFISLIPALGISIFMMFQIGFADPNLMVYISLISAACNVVIGILFILLSSSILRGNNIMAD